MSIGVEASGGASYALAGLVVEDTGATPFEIAITSDHLGRGEGNCPARPRSQRIGAAMTSCGRAGCSMAAGLHIIARFSYDIETGRAPRPTSFGLVMRKGSF